MRRSIAQVPTGSYAVLVLGAAGYFCFLFTWFLLPAFLTPIMRDLGLTGTQAGVLTGAIPLVYIPLGLASGLLIDRVGARHGIGIGLVFIGVGQASRAFAIDFPTMLVPTILIGIGGTGVTFGLPKLVSVLFPPEKSGTMSSVYLVGSGLGSATAFATARPLLEPVLGAWQPVFYLSGLVVAGFGLVWLVAYVVFTRSAPRFDRRAGGDAPEAAFSLASVRRDARQVISHRDLRLVVVIGTMYLFVSHGLQAWLPTMLEARGFGAGLAGTMASLLVLSKLAGVISIPPISDYLGRRRPAVIVCGCLGAGGTAGLIVGGGAFWVTVAVVVVAGLGIGGVSPLIRAIPIELDGIGPRLTATATGLIFSVGEIGGFLGPVLIGAFHDLTGTFATGIIMLAFGGVVVVIAGILMREPRTSPARTPVPE